jgi:hypothetical protein
MKTSARTNRTLPRPKHLPPGVEWCDGKVIRDDTTSDRVDVYSSLELSHEDRRLVEQLEAKFQIIRDRVVSVAAGYATSVYIVGRPGTSKTFTVEEQLAQLDIPWVCQNARMTPMGLFDFLAEHPEHVVVLDDIGSLFKNEAALQILLAALGGKPGQPRRVTYKSKDQEQRFFFSGGIIAISNVPLRNDPLAHALGSRITMLEHEPLDEEIAAFMRLLASEGFGELAPKECLDVVEFLINETRNVDQRLDLRHLTKAWQDYRQCVNGHAQTPWQDLVRTSLRKVACEPPVPLSKKDDIERQRALVRELLERYPGDRTRQLAEWPHSRSLLYARIKEVTATPQEAA